MFCTCPDQASASRIVLVDERLAACVNVLRVHSVYRWQDAIGSVVKY